MTGAPILVTPPACEPIELADARDFIGVEGTALDTRLDAATGMARGALEAMTGLRLINQTVDLIADGFADLGRLAIGPVRSVTHIKYRDACGVEQTLAGNNYELTGGGIERGVRRAFGKSWPAIDPRPGAVTIRLEVGFGAAPTDMPRDLSWALLVLIRAGIDDQAADVGHLIGNWRIYA